jgi:hypothetical protein
MKKQLFVSLMLTCVVCLGALIKFVPNKSSKPITYNCFCIKSIKKFPDRKTEFLFEKICGDFPNGVWAAQSRQKELQKIYNGTGITVTSFEVSESFCK